MQTPAGKPSSLAKPTLDTLFYIDYSWWDRNADDLRTYLLSHLLPDQRDRLKPRRRRYRPRNGRSHPARRAGHGDQDGGV